MRAAPGVGRQEKAAAATREAARSSAVPRSHLPSANPGGRWSSRMPHDGCAAVLVSRALRTVSPPTQSLGRRPHRAAILRDAGSGSGSSSGSYGVAAAVMRAAAIVPSRAAPPFPFARRRRQEPPAHPPRRSRLPGSTVAASLPCCAAPTALGHNRPAAACTRAREQALSMLPCRPRFCSSSVAMRLRLVSWISQVHMCFTQAGSSRLSTAPVPAFRRPW